MKKRGGGGDTALPFFISPFAPAGANDRLRLRLPPPFKSGAGGRMMVVTPSGQSIRPVIRGVGPNQKCLDRPGLFHYFPARENAAMSYTLPKGIPLHAYEHYPVAGLPVPLDL